MRTVNGLVLMALEALRQSRRARLSRSWSEVYHRLVGSARVLRGCSRLAPFGSRAAHHRAGPLSSEL
jgi:hypothetical protein